MKQTVLKCAQGCIILVGLGTMVLMLWEPHLEGRNVHSTVWQIYFNDPFLAFVYLASVPYFIALFHVFRLVGIARQDAFISGSSLDSLRTIRYCAWSLVGSIIIALVLLFVFQQGDDIAGGVAIGLFLFLFFAAASSTVMKMERHMRHRILEMVDP